MRCFPCSIAKCYVASWSFIHQALQPRKRAALRGPQHTPKVQVSQNWCKHLKDCWKGEDRHGFSESKPLSSAWGLLSGTLEMESSYGHFQAARLNLLKSGRAIPTVRTKNYPPKVRRWTGQWQEEMGYFPEVCLKCSVYNIAFFLWEMKRKYKKRG